jgi:uncharacterized protein YbaP (TraB family)
MKKYTLQIVFLLLSLNFLHAQDSLKHENALLWQISGNGLQESSYIFGTIHMIPETDFFFLELWKEKLLTCKTLALEIDINMGLAEQFELAKKILLPEGKTLADYMTKEKYLEFQSYILDSLNIKKTKWNQMNKIKPLFSMSLIYEDLMKNMKTYEVELNAMALKNGIVTVGLETADYQIDILNGISIEEQIDMLTGTELSGDPVAELAELVKIYKAQDLNKMLEMYKEDPEMIKYEDQLLLQRNKNWIPIIEKLIRQGTTFVAVGSMHLPGKNGILLLIRDAGYDVKPVMIKY